jgi:hypothetical protein
MSSRLLKIILTAIVCAFLLFMPYLGVNMYSLHVFTLIEYTYLFLLTEHHLGHRTISIGHAAFAVGAYTSALLTARLGLPFQSLVC